MNQPATPSSTDSHWLIALLFALSLIAFVAFLSLSQITASEVGARLLSRTVAETVDLDAALPGIESALLETLEQGTQDPLTVPDFPLTVLITRDEAIGAASEDLHARILNTAGDALYNNGIAVWDDADPDASQAIARSSTAGAVRLGIGFIGSTQHVIFLALAVVAGLATLLFAFGLTAQMSALRRLIALGTLTAAAAVPSFIAALLVAALLPALGSGAYSDSILDIAVNADGVAVRNFLIVSLLGLAVAATGLASASLQDRSGTS